MAKILFLNDYPMHRAAALCAQGLYPAQHLWGVQDLHRHGHEVITIPDSTPWGAPSRWKFLGQQWQAWRGFASRADLVYSACQYNVWALARLRRIGLLKVPLVTLVHHPLGGPLQGQGWVQGHDALLFLGNRVLQDARQRFGVALPDASAIDWGPDLCFADAQPPADGPSVDVFSAGKTHRDFKVLHEAARGAGWTLEYVGPVGDPAAQLSPAPNVTARFVAGNSNLSYPQMYARLKQARVVAVPMLDVPRHQAGLTSIVDGLAVGRPVVVTRNRWLGMDVEALGVGIFVDPGDVAGWRRAIDGLLADPLRASAMGERGRAWAQSHGPDHLSAALAITFDRVLSGEAQEH